MARRACTRRELLDRWRAIQDDLEDDDPSPSKQRRILQAKEGWFSDSFDFLVNLLNENHIWCGCPDLMGPLLETFHNYFQDKNDDSPLKLIWKRVSLELGCCTQCVCQHHQAQESYEVEYQLNTVDPLLKVLRLLDEERVTEHLKEINRRIQHKEYDPKCHSAEVISVMFEVLVFPVMLDDYSLSNEFQVFIEAVDDSYELTLSSNQQYPGVYALLFFRSGKARAIGLRLARYMGKLRRAADLEPLQPLLRKYIGFLEMEVLPSTLDNSRPRVQLERPNVWLGIKTLLGFLEAPAFEDGILERYPVFLNIVLNHVSDDTSDFSCAVSCLKVSFEMLGCKLWLRTTLSPSVMRNTLLGHCFHTRNEKSHKEIFDLFLPFLQSLEALQDGEHEKQRRNILYFLLHQVTCSSNFSILMRKNACKIALLIVQRGYMMNPPSPPFECAHMWGPSLISSLKDSSLHSSLRQPAFDLINVILISDASALISVKSNHLTASNIYVSNYTDADDDEDEQPFSCDVEEKDNSCWSDFSIQNKLTSQECKDWLCVPLLWFDTMVQVDCSMLPISFSKAVFWALSHISLFEPESTSFSSLSIEDWLTSYAGDISSSFVWEIPKGADDGGRGKDSTNSVKLSQQCTLLIRTFKRFASHFIMQIERHELQKQWTWEPRMAESLILLLIDPNDNTRQVARGILEHVSKARGLTSGLQFLCSSASSLSAIFLGLRFALRLVQRNLLLVNFQSLHHLFFIMRKLLKEVVSSPQKSPNTLDSVKSLPEGGFLRQNCSNYSPGRALENSASVVDTGSWNTFSYVLSAMTWPSIQKCIEEGKELINSKPCQMTNVRLLEMLPVVYERLNTYSSMPSGSMVTMMPDVFNLTWLSDLVEWGKSSLIVIIRHWRQCMLSLLEILKGSHNGIVPYIVATEAIISPDTILIDELKEKIFSLIIMLSKESSGSIEGRIGEQLYGRPSFDKKSVDPKRCNVLERDEGAKPDHAIRDETVIVLSDDETEKTPSKKLASKKVLLDDHMKSDRTSSLKEKMKPFPSRIFVKDSQLLLQKKGDHVLETSSISSAFESTGSRSTIIPSKGIATEKRISKSSTASDTSVSLKIIKSSDKSGHHQSSAQSSLNSDKVDSIVKDVIQDDENDPMERALDKSQRTILLTKPTVSAPRRQVVQLQLPTGNKSSSLSKMGTCVRRLKPPKLDSWYKDILEIDFFAVVGLSSADGDDNKMSNLKEVPLCFNSQNHYVDIFRPLVLEEFKAQLHSSFMENSSDDMVSGSLCILSVERIDDFLLVRGRPDGNGANMSRGFIENDLVFLTKDPLKSSSQNVHVLGKVERREKSDKNQSLILVIRFYLSNDSSRLNKVRRLLVERSKWFLSRIMSITPQLREFQALSSLHDIPILPVILNPVDCSPSYPESRNIQLGKLSQPLQKVLMSSFNDSQLQAISVAIGTLNSRNSELSLIQGPPGTGKTRTVVAIVSALLALPTTRKNYSSKFQTSDSKSSNIGCTNSRVKVSQSAAMARAWQDAAFARQVIKDSKKDSLGTTEHSSRGRILICAQSNAAVDELVSRLNEGLFGIDGKVYKPYIVRVGNAKTVHPNSLPFFIDTLVEQRLVEEVKNQTARNDMDAESSSSLRARLEKVVDNIRYYESKRAKLKDGDTMGKISFDDRPSKEDDVHEVSDEAIGIKLNMLYGQKRTICGDLAVSQSREKKLAEESKFLKHKVRKSILRDAEIVLTTLSGCGGDIYGVCSESASAGRFGNFSEQTLFDVVIIDEAAQALEPATLIPLQLLKSNETKCLMVGDPKQLPATVLSNVASKFLYECSMFERLQRAGHPVVMLTEQYRMHPEICRFPSLHFYENKLLNGAQMTSKSAPFHENHLLGPYMFFDIVDGHECHGKNTGFQSLFNDSEADAATEILKFLKKRYPSEFGYKKIGIITPYRSQLSLLRSRFSSMFGPEVLSDIELNTVDGFQGREVDILVLSTVRASDSSARSSSIGFVADVRRMNVALTRAKFSLWIVGNAKTLQTNLHWAALIQNAKERKLFISVSRPYSSIFGKVLSSSKGAASPILDSFSSKGKKDGRGKGGSSDIQHARASTVEVHTGKAKHASKKKDKHTGRHSEDYPLTNLKVIQNLPKNSHQPLGVQEQDQGCSEDGKSMVAQRHTEGKIANKLNETNTEELKMDTIVKRGERAKVNIPLQKDSNTKSSLTKAKEARKLPEQHKSNKDQGDSSHLTCSEERNLHQTKAIDKRKSTEFAKQDQLISSRKRQRDAVDSLLSSALISSKKPLSKNASVKKGP